MAQDYSENAALKLAKETVLLLEKQSGGDMNKVLGSIAKMKGEIGKVPTSDDIFKQRVGELASAYAKVSDGAGGTKGATKQALDSFSNVLAGKTPDGNSYALSQKLALLAEKSQHLVEGIKIPPKVRDVIFETVESGARFTEKNAGKFGLAGRAVGAVTGAATTFVATSGNASASELGESALNGAMNGLGTLVGQNSKESRLCKLFGDVVVPGAIGVGVSFVATPAAGMAAGAAASSLSEPATKGCNNLFQKAGP